MQLKINMTTRVINQYVHIYFPILETFITAQYHRKVI